MAGGNGWAGGGAWESEVHTMLQLVSPGSGGAGGHRRDCAKEFRRLLAPIGPRRKGWVSSAETDSRAARMLKRAVMAGLEDVYDRRPVLFRPPFGTKDATTLRAAHDCGIKAAFMWKETVHKGKVRYQAYFGGAPRYTTVIDRAVAEGYPAIDLT